MNDDDDLPEGLQPPTLRRQNAISGPDDLLREFIDTETGEIIIGNPALSDPSNQNLVECTPEQTRTRQTGSCKPASFFFHNKDDDDSNSPAPLSLT